MWIEADVPLDLVAQAFGDAAIDLDERNKMIGLRLGHQRKRSPMTNTPKLAMFWRTGAGSLLSSLVTASMNTVQSLRLYVSAS